MTDVARLTDRVPNSARHHGSPAGARSSQQPTSAKIRELAKRPQVYVKVSGVLRRVSGRVPLDTDFYRDRLDTIWDIFGPDRLIYGSDWPNSDPLGTYPQVLKIVEEYFHAKGPRPPRNTSGETPSRHIAGSDGMRANLWRHEIQCPAIDLCLQFIASGTSGNSACRAAPPGFAGWGRRK